MILMALGQRLFLLGRQRPVHGGGGAIIDRCVGHVHARQLAGVRLILNNRLQKPLAHFRLVGGVGGEK